MALLNTADKVRNGAALASAVYAGTHKVWPQAWSPAKLPGLVAWFDAADAASITAAAGKVSSWANKKAGGAPLVQATSAPQPVTGTRAIGGKNGLDFTPNQYLTAAIGTLTQPTTILAVVQCDTPLAGTLILYDANNDTNRHQTWVGGAASWNIYAGAVVTSTTGLATATPANIATVYNTIASDFYLNGASVFGGTANVGAATMTGLYLGASNTLNGWDGIVGEFVVMNAAISPADRALWNAYTLAKWGV